MTSLDCGSACTALAIAIAVSCRYRPGPARHIDGVFVDGVDVVLLIERLGADRLAAPTGCRAKHLAGESPVFCDSIDTLLRTRSGVPAGCRGEPGQTDGQHPAQNQPSSGSPAERHRLPRTWMSAGSSGRVRRFASLVPRENHRELFRWLT